MSRKQLEVITCDRCREETTLPDDKLSRGPWVVMGASRAGLEWIGGDCGADLCPACSFELGEWFFDPAVRVPRSADQDRRKAG